mgnify:CR=1 FL=1
MDNPRACCELDFASMVYARRCLFSSEQTWHVHLRVDASPQGGRDYLVVEGDVCSNLVASPDKMRTVGQCPHILDLVAAGGTIVPRLFPLRTLLKHNCHRPFVFVCVCSGRALTRGWGWGGSGGFKSSRVKRCRRGLRGLGQLGAGLGLGL